MLLITVYKQTPSLKKVKFSVGEIVRVNQNLRMFTKKSTSINWSTKLYRVKSFKSANPHIYTLQILMRLQLPDIFMPKRF